MERERTKKTIKMNSLLYYKKIDIAIFIKQYLIYIALISETHFTNSYSLDLPGFRLHHTNHLDGTAHAGAAIYVRSSLTLHPLQKFQTAHNIQSCAVSIIVKNIPVLIAAIYCPPKHNICTNQFNIYFNTLGHNFIW